MSMDDKLLRLNGILWGVSHTIGRGMVVKPLCPIHRLRIYPNPTWDNFAQVLYCEECKKPYSIPRTYEDQKTYVRDKIYAKNLKNLPILNLDDEAIPLAEAKVKTKDEKFFVVANLNESKTGKRLVVYVGEKGKPNKTQIFVEPEIRRLSFDQKDIHPLDVFIKLEATFPDGTTAETDRKKLKREEDEK